MSSGSHVTEAKDGTDSRHTVSYSTLYEGVTVQAAPEYCGRLVVAILPEGVEATDARVAPLRTLQQRCWEIAESKGWHEPNEDGHVTTFAEQMALVHSEVSRALEEHRNGRDRAYVMTRHGQGPIWLDDAVLEPMDGGDIRLKPQGTPIELADAFIRILHVAEIEGIDLAHAVEVKSRYNAHREHRHGGKRL